MTREELISRQSQQLRAMMERHNTEVLALSHTHRMELLSLTIGEDTADRAVEMLEIITGNLEQVKQLNYPCSAEHEDAKWLLRTVNETLEEIKRKYAK